MGSPRLRVKEGWGMGLEGKEIELVNDEERNLGDEKEEIYLKRLRGLVVK